MSLHAYLLGLDEPAREALARECQTTVGYLFKLARQFKQGVRAHPTLAARLELHSNQKVRRWELNPEDWAATWPELVGQPGAPLPGGHAVSSQAANDPSQQGAA